MNRITLYYADNVRGNELNKKYNAFISVSSPEEMRRAVSCDHVTAKYRNCHRSKQGFIEADCLPMDCDNDHSDDPVDWKLPHDVQRAFPGAAFWVCYSRNHMKSKDGKVARPKFHVYFPIAPITDPQAYADMKKAARAVFPEFDGQALDAARFFFGVDGPQVEFCEGERLLSDILQVIPAGQRNSTLSHEAGRLLTRYGDTPQARQEYDTLAGRCSPALDGGELETIWRSAQGFYHTTVEKAPDYVPPAEYNKEMPAFVTVDKKGVPRVSPQLLAGQYAADHPYKIVLGAGDPKIYDYRGGAYICAEPIEIKATLAKYITDYNPLLLTPATIASAYEILYLTGEQMHILDFNRNESLVCFKNCVYDFLRRKRYPHSPDYLFTGQLTVDLPDGPTPTPVTDAYLDDLMRGNPDGRKTIMEVAGVAFSNVLGWRFKKGLFLIGKGNTGKTQIKQLCERIVGPGHFNNCELETLESNRFAAATFQGKRLCGSNDMTYARAPEISKFKLLTGGDNIEAERKHETSYHFRYDGVIWFCANQMPLFGGDKGDHVYDRILPLYCHNVIPTSRQNKQLCDHMYTEAGGFVLKALEAARAAVLNNFTYTMPEESAKGLEQYKKDNSEFRQFLDECTQPQDEFAKADTTAAVFQSYKTWCHISQAKVTLSKGQFWQELSAALGIDRDEMIIRKSTGTFFPVKLTDAAKVELGASYL